MLQILAAAAEIGRFAGTTLANHFGSGEDGKETAETRLLKILKDRGVLKDGEFDELLKLGRKMREQELLTTSAHDKEIRSLAIGGIAAPLLPTYDVHTVGGDFVMKYQGLFLTSEFYYAKLLL